MTEIKIDEKYLFDNYKHLHKYPELSMKERKTSEYIVNKIKELYIPYEIVGEYGIIGIIENGEGKGLLLRADMDGLPVTESENNLIKEKEFISLNEGIAHVCGHDGHMSMLMSSAKYLMENKDKWSGTIYLCFEQAEETGEGIGIMMEALEKYSINYSWGIHLYSNLESGKISIDEGPRMSGSMPFNLLIKGTGGHGSRPDKTDNPIKTGIEIINMMYSFLAQGKDPLQRMTFSIGEFIAGTVHNIIPSSARISGTFRVFDIDYGNQVYDELEKITAMICELNNCDYEFLYKRENPEIVVNDRECSKIAEKGITKYIGKDVIKSVPPWMASESVSFYLNKYPGVYAFVGIKNNKKGTGAEHHSPEFEIDKDSLTLGAKATIGYVLEILKII